MSNKIHSIVIDGLFDDSLKLFADNLSPNEEVVSTVVAKDRLIICTRTVEQSVDVKQRNLLLEEIQARPLKVI